MIGSGRSLRIFTLLSTPPKATRCRGDALPLSRWLRGRWRIVDPDQGDDQPAGGGGEAAHQDERWQTEPVIELPPQELRPGRPDVRDGHQRGEERPLGLVGARAGGEVERRQAGDHGD